MQKRAAAAIAVALLIGLAPVAALADLAPYNQDFENLIMSDIDALTNDGWLVFGNVFSPGGDYLYGYGPFGAPNDGAAFCAIVSGQGGTEQGAQQLSVYSDYLSAEHANGNLVESNVYQEQTVGAGDLSGAWVFEFQAKRGTLAGNTTALAFIKTLDPANGFALTNFVTVDLTDIGTEWGGYSLYLVMDESLEGQLFQIGFSCTATNYEDSGVIYDNVIFYYSDTIDAPASPAIGATLGQNYPNPFNPKTRIDFELELASSVDISIFDLEGRRVATAFEGELGAGRHAVNWNGMTAQGAPAAAGKYMYVLATPTGKISRSMILLK